jgi:hypothetical protein
MCEKKCALKAMIRVEGVAFYLWSTCMSHLIFACVTAFSMSDLRGDHEGTDLMMIMMMATSQRTKSASECAPGERVAAGGVGGAGSAEQGRDVR